MLTYYTLSFYDIQQVHGESSTVYRIVPVTPNQLDSKYDWWNYKPNFPIGKKIYLKVENNIKLMVVLPDSKVRIATPKEIQDVSFD